ncbi:MAG: hypothetical protein ACHQHO_04900 [Solirubrobacterales bacterium]
MAQLSRSRLAVSALCVVLVAGLPAVAGELSPACALSLPLEQAPAVSAQTSTVAVVVPVPVEVPPLPESTTSVSIETPAVPGVPTISAKTTAAPSQASSAQVSASVSLQSPSFSRQTPAVEATGPAGSVATRTEAPAARSGPEGAPSGSAGAPPSAGGGGPSSSPLGDSAAVAAPAQRYRGGSGWGNGYEEPPPPRGAPARLGTHAVHELHHEASMLCCNRAGDAVDGFMLPLDATFDGAGAHAAGGVEAVSYVSLPIGRIPLSPSTLGVLFAAGAPPVASDVILVLALLGGLGMAVTLLIADAAGQGPRHELWRRRVVNRLRSLR